MNRKKTWVLVAGALVLILSFLFSDGLRQTFHRRRAVRLAEEELDRLNHEADDVRQKINRIETDPNTKEQMVRKELGYMKPGEKEVRFIGGANDPRRSTDEDHSRKN